VSVTSLDGAGEMFELLAGACRAAAQGCRLRAVSALLDQAESCGSDSLTEDSPEAHALKVFAAAVLAGAEEVDFLDAAEFSSSPIAWTELVT
jgi:hypothetical protein